jgi:hypothetical protein
MKVEKNPKSFYIFGYLLEFIMKIWLFGLFIFQYLANLGHFLMQNTLYRSKSYFLGQNLAKIHQQKKHYQCLWKNSGSFNGTICKELCGV